MAGQQSSTYLTKDNMWVTIYTDASWFPETKEGGWGFWAKSDRGRITKHGKLPKWVKCSNSAEIAAILIGVVEIFETWRNEEIKGVLVCTDSQVAMHYLKYRPNGVEGLKRNDWLKIRAILYELLDSQDCLIKIRHVKGHQKTNTRQAWLNNKVDEFTRKF